MTIVLRSRGFKLTSRSGLAFSSAFHFITAVQKVRSTTALNVVHTMAITYEMLSQWPSAFQFMTPYTILLFRHHFFSFHESRPKCKDIGETESIKTFRLNNKDLALGKNVNRVKNAILAAQCFVKMCCTLFLECCKCSLKYLFKWSLSESQLCVEGLKVFYRPTFYSKSL